MEKLTGRVRFRTTWIGKLVLQVEGTTRWFVYGEGWKEETGWRDANFKDFADVEVELTSRAV